jgi:uncharacterized protein YybS (DUF2232 family)
MTGPWWLLSAGAGIASAVLYGIVPPSPLGAMMVVVLVSVPLFMAGLSLGAMAALVASATGIVAALALHGPAVAGVFAMCFGVPVLIMVRQALLSRSGDAGIEWYPAGLLAATLTVIGLALAVIFTTVLPMLGVQEFAEVLLQGFAESLAAGTEGVTAEEVLEQINIERMLRLMPGMISGFWMLALLAGGSIAQAILEKTGRNLRPSPEFSRIELPNWLAIVAAIIMAAGMFVPGVLGDYAVAMAFAACFPFLVQGLALVHAFIRKIRGGTILLVIFYLLVFVPVWPVMLVVLLGAVEQFAGFRQRWENGTET